jgi:hypothetical protein
MILSRVIPTDRAGVVLVLGFRVKFTLPRGTGVATSPWGSISVLNDRQPQIGNVPQLDYHRPRDRGGGSLWPWITRLGLGRLAGEIFIQRDNFQTLSRQISIGNFRLRFSPSAATIHEQKQ